MEKQETKNQHYVPQFCFDLFFPSGKFCYMTVLMADNERIIFFDKANKKTQSSSPYFYGKDKRLKMNILYLKIILEIHYSLYSLAVKILK